MRKSDTIEFEKELKLKQEALFNSAQQIDAAIRKSNDERRGDDVDLAEVEIAQERSLQLRNKKFFELKQIEVAMKKLEAGTYGLCENCDSKIPPKRLKVLPYSLYCIECQEELELEEKLNK
ncbi:MAG: TraR/DksA family transcriptional regulator [Nitrospinota bacterium]